MELTLRCTKVGFTLSSKLKTIIGTVIISHTVINAQCLYYFRAPIILIPPPLEHHSIKVTMRCKGLSQTLIVLFIATIVKFCYALLYGNFF